MGQKFPLEKATFEEKPPQGLVLYFLHLILKIHNNSKCNYCSVNHLGYALQ